LPQKTTRTTFKCVVTNTGHLLCTYCLCYKVKIFTLNLMYAMTYINMCVCIHRCIQGSLWSWRIVSKISFHAWILRHWYMYLYTQT
jgi:hypothetical protein